MDDNTYMRRPIENDSSDSLTLNVTMLFAVYSILAVCAYYIKKSQNIRPLPIATTAINSLV